MSAAMLNAVTFDALRALAEMSADPRPAARALQALHEALIEPFLRTIEHTGARVLVVQASGALRRIPFGVLHDGQRYLIERIAIVTHPGSMPLQLKRRLRHPVHAVSVAVAQAPDMDELPAVLLDAQALKDCLQRDPAARVQTLLGAEADVARVEALLATRPSLLHVSSHFEVDQADASRSAFVWANGARYTLEQLARLDLSSVQLALMLGCETQSVSEVAGTMGITAIDSLLLRMGVGAVIGTAWRVWDDVAHAMLEAFLEQVFVHRDDLASALRAAVLAVARDPLTGETMHPHTWGAFVLSGDWSGLDA